ncbi:MAG: recombinase family protein [Eubacteriales bacterium]|nr:recombinase family protein [Eubacteriales bacterium]
MSNKNITVIPAKPVDFMQGLPGLMKRRKVAGYARVSTDKDEQQNSYEAQVDYYASYIQRNPEWEFVEVYTDEGISGTSTKHREGFKRMIADALDGKIDLILTKSVSRFARNTVDSLTTIRKLKENGTEVYFEKENIYTLDSKGELLLTIMASLAQEESRSISKNITWGKRKSMADGKVSFAYSSFLGYDMGGDGHLYIVEEQAEIVRRIYDEFLAGKTTYDIAARLTKEGVPTPMKKTKWQESTVRSILKNVKYRGDSVLQSTFVEDFLTKKVKKNNGELPQFYVSQNHPPIIPPEKFEMVQEEFRRRKEGGPYTCISPFSGRIVCGDCGGFYGRKVWHSGERYQSFVWHCNNKFAKRKYCSTPTVKEDAITKCFVDAFNSVLIKKNEVAQNYEKCLAAITDDREHKRRLAEVDEICTGLAAMMRDNLTRESRMVEDCGEDSPLKKEREGITAEYEILQKEHQELTSKIALCAAKKVQIRGFLQLLKKQKKALAEFDPLVWQAAVHYMVINEDCTVKFVFRDGTELPWTIDPGVKAYKKRKTVES